MHDEVLRPLAQGGAADGIEAAQVGLRLVILPTVSLHHVAGAELAAERLLERLVVAHRCREIVEGSGPGAVHPGAVRDELAGGFASQHVLDDAGLLGARHLRLELVEELREVLGGVALLHDVDGVAVPVPEGHAEAAGVVGAALRLLEVGEHALDLVGDRVLGLARRDGVLEQASAELGDHEELLVGGVHVADAAQVDQAGVAGGALHVVEHLELAAAATGARIRVCRARRAASGEEQHVRQVRPRGVRHGPGRACRRSTGCTACGTGACLGVLLGLLGAEQNAAQKRAGVVRVARGKAEQSGEGGAARAQRAALGRENHVRGGVGGRLEEEALLEHLVHDAQAAVRHRCAKAAAEGLRAGAEGANHAQGAAKHHVRVRRRGLHHRMRLERCSQIGRHGLAVHGERGRRGRAGRHQRDERSNEGVELRAVARMQVPLADAGEEAAQEPVAGLLDALGEKGRVAEEDPREDEEVALGHVADLELLGGDEGAEDAVHG
mmetsp:Transcript_4097/g.17155  ORF Transcript_4097/g.17155 Transcript_4097/m.17155 type:complete len:496 (+) Transcript_4097:3149-4636(+)